VISGEKMTAFTARLQGVVQGVGFRYSTLHQARRLGVRGYVRNNADGSVEVTAEGRAEQLASFRAWLEHGPSGAVVSNARFSEIPYGGKFTSFIIEY